jgi:hypothetical protein
MKSFRLAPLSKGAWAEAALAMALFVAFTLLLRYDATEAAVRYSCVLLVILACAWRVLDQRSSRNRLQLKGRSLLSAAYCLVAVGTIPWMLDLKSLPGWLRVVTSVGALICIGAFVALNRRSVESP